jgi:hypothetical protein
MIRGILIAGNESALATAVAAEAAKRVTNFVAAFIPNRFSDAVKEKTVPSTGTFLNWNPGSPISARTLVLAAENRLERIDDAILVCVPPALYKQPDELSSADIEIMVNDYIKGWFFLVKELAAVFKAKKAGTLSLVLVETNANAAAKDSIDLLGPSATASFRAFTQNLLSSSLCDSFQVMGFSASDTGDDNAFAAFIFKLIEESSKRNNGRWHKFGKLSLFGR